MKIEYSENATGRHTEVLDRDRSGNPMASRFPGWWSPEEVIMYLNNARARYIARGEDQ